MRSNFLSVLGSLVAAIVLPGIVHGNSLPVIQNPDGQGYYLSQNDTTGGGGLLAQVYDNFTLSSLSSIDNVTWVGTYAAPSPSPIDSFTISFWSGIAGTGGLIAGNLLATETITGNSNETQLGTDAYGNITYGYSANLTPVNLFNGTWWISIVANMPTTYGSNGQNQSWNWETSSQGDGLSYQDSYGFRWQNATDFAFTVSGTGPTPNFSVPEPGTLSLVAFGLLGLGGMARLRRKAIAAA